MIKKILDWILGKNEKPQEAAAPYKVEAPVEALPLVQLEQTTTTPAVEQRYVGENEQGAIYEQVAVAAEAVPVAIETAPVTVKAKFKKAELAKLSKKALVELAGKHGVEIKARATKDIIIKSLLKA